MHQGRSDADEQRISGGLLMLVAAYALFLVPTAAEPNGLLNRYGYRFYALAGALMMAVAILVSAIGTHREIKGLPKPPLVKVPLRVAISEPVKTVHNPPSATLMTELPNPQAANSDATPASLGRALSYLRMVSTVVLVCVRMVPVRRGAP